MTKIAGSGSISQRHGSEDPDPDPPQNVMDLQHCFKVDEKAQKTEKCILYICLRMSFYIHFRSKRLHFVKQVKIAVP